MNHPHVSTATANATVVQNSLSLPVFNTFAPPLLSILPLWQTFRRHAFGALLLSFFALGVSLVVHYGWPVPWARLSQTPIIYGGDGSAFLTNFQRMQEGAWYYINSRSGFPFGSNFTDFPTTDFVSYGFIWLMKHLGLGAVATLNLYYFLGYALCAGVSFVVLKSLRFSTASSVVGAVAYAFIPYHAMRAGHLFFTWYFTIPLAVHLCLRFLSDRLPLWPAKADGVGLWRRFKALAADVLLIILIASNGAYYAVFTSILLVLTGLIALLYTWRWRPGFVAAGAVMVLVAGVVMNVLPTVIERKLDGANPEAVSRQVSEAQLYGLKFTHLFMPHPAHRSSTLREWVQSYQATTPFNNENTSAALGFFAALGLVIVWVWLFRRLASSAMVKPSWEGALPSLVAPSLLWTKQRLRLLMLWIAPVFLVLLVLSTIGGLASLFTVFVTSAVRGWNRISIVFGWMGVLALLAWWEWFCAHRQALRGNGARGLAAAQSARASWRHKLLTGVGTALVLIFVLWDQTAKPCKSCLDGLQNEFQADARFGSQLQSSLAPHTAVYQLPYDPYPESTVNNMPPYQHIAAYLHTQNLRFSYGGMRGRAGDWFLRNLRDLPIAEQLPILKLAGFGAVSVDDRGYCDKAVSLHAELATALGVAQLDQAPSFVQHENGHIRSVSLANYALSPERQQAALQSLARIGFDWDASRKLPVPRADFAQAIDFRQVLQPHYVTYLGGFSHIVHAQRPDIAANSMLQSVWPPQRLKFENCSSSTFKPEENMQPMGRWMSLYDTGVASVWTAPPLPQKMSVTLRLRATPEAVGKPLTVRIGKQAQSIVLTADWQDHRLTFDVPANSHQIQLLAPRVRPSHLRLNGDSRRLLYAVQVQTLQISPLISPESSPVL